jgi:radical SAM protein with 4Fe4S-binding SPASM domain
MTSYLNQLLERKLPDASEIELHLFELCNLRCHFCGQDHDDRTGFDAILDKVGPVQDFIAKNPKKNHILNIMGGEIFNDELPDSIFGTYAEFAQRVNDFALGSGHKCTFNWVTNLIFNKSDRVKIFLEELDGADIKSNISTSYDFTGRKNSLWNHDVFKKNLETFKNRVFTVGFVLTKPAINSLMTKKDEFFDYIYLNYPIYFDYYVPENGANVLMPSDQDLLDAYLFIAKKYPKISPVKELLENAENKMTCYSLNKLTLLPDGREVKCRYLHYKEGQFKNQIDYNSNENIIQSHLDENECFSCEWYSRCGFRCFVQADWAQRKANEICLFKTFFKEISLWN